MDTATYLLTALFTLAIFAVSAAAVELSGFYPVAARPEALRSSGGRLLISALGLLALGLATTALWIGLTGLPWPVVVIASGLAFLSAPLAFQAVPRRFWDSCTGAAVIAVSMGALLLVLLRLYL